MSWHSSSLDSSIHLFWVCEKPTVKGRNIRITAPTPEEARKIHYGEKEDKPIYGEATEKESKDLIEEGVPLIRLPFEKKQKKKN